MAYNILLVDDSKTTRAVMSKTFRLAGIPVHELFEAANGAEALELLRAHWIDVVFADINMPVMDGEELLRRMREDEALRTIPVVMVSIEGSESRLEQLRAQGVSAFVRKPFTPEALRKVLEEVLQVQVRASQPEQLCAVFVRVLEQYAFLLGEPVSPEAAAAPPGGALRAAVRFRGPFSGTLEIAIPENLAPQIAGNVLGTEADDVAAQAQYPDALKELVNVLCGQWLTEVAGGKARFEISLPEVGSFDAQGWESLRAAPNTLAFSVEGAPVLVRFTPQPRSP